MCVLEASLGGVMQGRERVVEDLGTRLLKTPPPPPLDGVVLWPMLDCGVHCGEAAVLRHHGDPYQGGHHRYCGNLAGFLPWEVHRLSCGHGCPAHR